MTHGPFWVCQFSKYELRTIDSRSASGHVPTYCGRNSASLRLALFASRCVILIPLHRGTLMGSHSTQLAAAQGIIQNSILWQLWRLHMKSALLPSPNLTYQTCHCEGIEKTIDEFRTRRCNASWVLLFTEDITSRMRKSGFRVYSL